MEEKRFSGTISEDYDAFSLACSHFTSLQEHVGTLIEEYAGKHSTEQISVLEIGCGTGHTTLVILKSSPNTQVVAVDSEPIMMAQAKENLKPFLNDRVLLVEEEGLAFLQRQQDHSFSVFASGFTLHNIPKDIRSAMLKEIYRVLKPSGIFINADKYAQDDAKAHARALSWQLDSFNTVFSSLHRPDLIKEWTDHYEEDEKPNVIMHASTAISFMKDLGFKDTSIVFRKHMDAVLFAKKND